MRNASWSDLPFSFSLVHVSAHVIVSGRWWWLCPTIEGGSFLAMHFYRIFCLMIEWRSMWIDCFSARPPLHLLLVENRKNLLCLGLRTKTQKKKKEKMTGINEMADQNNTQKLGGFLCDVYLCFAGDPQQFDLSRTWRIPDSKTSMLLASLLGIFWERGAIWKKKERKKLEKTGHLDLVKEWRRCRKRI